MNEKRRDFFVSTLLCLLCLLVFGRCVTFEHTLYDDPNIIFENEEVQKGLTLESIRWAFTTPNFGLYMALPTLTFMLDVDLFGDWDGGFHGHTLLWHLICVVSFYVVMRRLTGSFAPVVAASLLVAVHPVQSMTVNWISARNEIIPAVFLLWSIDFYRQGALQKDNATLKRQLLCYSISVLFMLLGLLSKQGFVLLPAMLLLLDYWPLYRIRLQLDAPVDTLKRMVTLTLEKIPWFLLSFLGVALAFYGKKNFGAFADEKMQSPFANIGFACVSFFRYLYHLVYPEKFMMAYTTLHWSPGWWMVTGAALLLISITALGLLLLWRRPWLIVFWAWFVLFLLPVSGLVRYASESIALRYLYLPAMGIYLLLCFALYAMIQYVLPVKASGKSLSSSGKKRARKEPGLEAEKKGRTEIHPLFWAIVLVVTVACAAQAYRQSGFWKNGEILAQRALTVSEGMSAIAHNHLSVYKDRQGLSSQAFSHAKAAFELEPGRGAWRANYATALSRQERFAECLEVSRPLLKTQPEDVMPNHLVGMALTGLGRYEEAIPYLEKAISIESRYVPALYNLGICLEQLGRLEQALEQYEAALAEQPTHGLSLQRRAHVKALIAGRKK